MYPKDQWYEAITFRRSRRAFQNREIPDPLIKNLQRLCQEFRFPEARAAMVLKPADEIFKGILGSYGKIKGAPAYIAFIGNTGYPYFQEKVGYLGEGVILEATGLGLSTCWVGGFFKPDVLAEHLSLACGEKVLAVTPVGYSREDYSLGEKVMSGMVKGKKRKALAEMTEGLAEVHWPRWIKTALEAARLAPSAVNRQPWRFKVEPEQITLLLDSMEDTYQISKRLDCGIAMLHLELGARAAGVSGNWEYPGEQAVGIFTL
ncbi:nitroreductase family protein [Desulforamulus ruminis]|uniref:Nitroreductase n=1 Tax=Desulforamulus ruminis (strain ATCC 23193 / DSM 2154 / NCIMB 8452 / DL) TaxID=696281 RepID=F6DQE8_DESRL|nr:nitroreductase family protein [Desulforamulus ruminis]AEG60842.1 nitroreductase [Desulforamulus ruminis DSM 2154]